MAAANYTNLLLSAREAADARLQKKGLGGNSLQSVDDDTGPGKALVRRRYNESVDEEGEYDFGMEYFSKLRAHNVSLKKAYLEASTAEVDLDEGSSTGAMTDSKGNPVDILNQGDDVSINPPVSGETFFNLKHPKKAAELKKDEVFMARLSDMEGRYPGLTEDEIFKVIDGESAFNPKAVPML